MKKFSACSGLLNVILGRLDLPNPGISSAYLTSSTWIAGGRPEQEEETDE